jgi:hypothetical protein
VAPSTGRVGVGIQDPKSLIRPIPILLIKAKSLSKQLRTSNKITVDYK